MIKSLVLAAGLLVSAITAQADAYTIFGAGNLSCSQWLRLRHGDTVDQNSVVAWLGGYLSATNENFDNMDVGDILSKVDLDMASFWMDVHCEAHPTENIMTAASKFVDDVSRIARERRMPR